MYLLQFARETYKFWIFVIFVVLSVIFIVIHIPVNSYIFNSVVLESIHHNAFAVLRYLSSNLKERRLGSDIFDGIDLMFKKDKFLGIALLDENLNSIILSGKKDLIYSEMLYGINIENEKYIEYEDSIYHYFKRVEFRDTDNRDRKGYLALTLNTAGLYHNIDNINQIRIVLITGAFIILIILAYLLSVWLTKPFYVLAERIEGLLKGHNTVDNVEDLGFGDLNTIYEKIVNLVKSLNDLRDNLSFSEESLKAFLSKSRDIILILNNKLEIEYASPSFAEITGIDIDKAQSKLSIKDFMSENEFERLKSELNSQSGLLAPRDIEICLNRKDDQDVYLLASWIIREGGESFVNGIILFAKDITAHKQIEDLLKRQTEELETILFSLSHDLKSPVFTLKGMSHLFRQKYYSSLDEQGRHFVDRIAENIIRMERLISNMLDISRSKRQVFKNEEVNLNEIIDLLLTDCREQLVECDARIDAARDLPAIKGDKDKLYIVFKNLLENSLKYRSPNRVCKISISKNRREDGVELLFEDNGMGIESRFIERLFKPFSRAVVQTDGMPSGYGIGLSIVKGILDAHNCKITVESSYGEWTRFRIFIPSSIIVTD